MSKKAVWLYTLSCAVCFLTLDSWAADLPTIRIMPFGDSITHGTPIPGGYRAPLYQLLTNAGYKVDFVGNATDNPSSQLPDPQHEGHGGFRIDQLDAAFAGWVNAIPDPDIILLLIGTNDYGQGQDTAHATNRLDRLIGRITANRPNAKLIVANLLLRTDNASTYTLIRTTFNPFVPALVAKHAVLGEQVYFLDLNSQLTGRDLADGLHPNQTGYRRMATNWFGMITNLVSPLGSTNAPIISRATGSSGWTNVVVTFSKPVGPESTNIAHYAMSGGLEILSARLDPLGQRDVTLITSPQVPSRFYTVTAKDIFDLTVERRMVVPGSAATFLSAPTTNALNNVPEAADYTLVYSLNIPNTALFDTRGVNYTVDTHTNIPNFSRLAYYLELQRAGGTPQFIWVSMDGFTCDSGKIGLPLTTNGGSAQRYVTNMNVLSSVPGIVNGNGMSGGYLEFWPSVYSAGNNTGVPNASSLLYDWGDQRTEGRYGSMQIHNVNATQTLLAFNHWANGGAVVDLGIGNSTGAHPDWTFAANASVYAIKRLQVFVVPGPSFGRGPDLTVLEDASFQTVSNWATGITPRCPFENNSIVDFFVSNDNNALFSVQPSLNPVGTLTYTVASNAYGTALVSVRLSDNRGTTNGGQDLSKPQSFQITVLPVNDPPIAMARAFPLVSLSPDDTNVFVISKNTADAVVYFDASGSSDVEQDLLRFTWYVDGLSTPFATGMVVTNVLSLGGHTIQLVVSDGMDSNSNVIEVQVISIGETVERLIELVQRTALPRNEVASLLGTLNAARASFARGNAIAGLNQLEAFQNKVGAQVSPVPGRPLLAAAQTITSLLEEAESKMGRLSYGPNRELHLDVKRDPGRVHLVQASTNLADWVDIGIATISPDGTYKFMDHDAGRYPNRYYRFVSIP
jgi:lysophospholipase L1-like esterase